MTSPSRPFMLMSANPGFAADPNRARFWNGLRGPHYAVDVERARHFAFSDLVFFAPGLSRANPSAVFIDPSPVGTLARSHSLASARKASCRSENVRSMAAGSLTPPQIAVQVTVTGW